MGLGTELESDDGAACCASFLVTPLTGGAGGGGLRAKFGDPGTLICPALTSKGEPR